MSNNIAGWTQQQLRDFIAQCQRDNPQTPGSVQHRKVDIQDTLYVNGQPIVGPNVFPNRISATSGRGVPQGSYVDTSGAAARINDQYNRQTGVSGQFYNSFDKLIINSTTFFAAPNNYGTVIYVPVDCTLQAVGAWCTNLSAVTKVFPTQSASVYGPLTMLNTGNLVAQSASTAIDVVGTCKSSPPYPLADLGIVEFPLPATFIKAGVYATFFTLQNDPGTGVRPNFGWLNSIYDFSGIGLSSNEDGVSKSFFGESYLGVIASTQPTLPWVSTFAGLGSLTPSNGALWSYIKTT